MVTPKGYNEPLIKGHVKLMSSKITTEICKQAIVDLCAVDKQTIINQFVSLSEEEYQQTLLTKNWKRDSKQTVIDGEEKILRTFDCRPFDDQLRAYVYTDKDDSLITSIEIVGE